MRLAITRSDYCLHSEFLARTPKYNGIAKPVVERESSLVLVWLLIFLLCHPRTTRPHFLLVIIYSWSVAKWSEAGGLLASFKLFICVLCNDSAILCNGSSLEDQSVDHRGYYAKLCIVFLPSLCAAVVGISRVMITESLAGRLRRRSCRNCHSFNLLLAVLTSPKPTGWVGTSSVFPHVGCIEECWRVLIFGHEVKHSSYLICEEQILRVQTRVHQSTSYWKKGADPELSLYAE
ncbi:hypothetical protein PS2_039330 [Malus domestica]